MPLDERRARIARLSKPERAALAYSWQFWRRPNQTPPPGNWRVWLILSGRGFGKTRVAAEMARAWAREFSYVNLIGATADDARNILIEGESGILAVCPPSERPRYVKSERKLIWPNGGVSLIFTADEPERLRGKQHMKLICDELAAWRRPEAWDQALLGLRLGTNPQAVVTTTPKPRAFLRAIKADPGTVTTTGTTYDNRDNLAPAFYSEIISRYEGTRLGRQELNAELLDDNPGALWKRSEIDEHRVTKAPELARIVVAVDPEATSSETSAETGIIVAGKGRDGHGYILEDGTLRGSPARWGSQAVTLYHKYHADRLIAETNNGGDMIEHVIRTVEHGQNVAFHKVTASRGKYTRAEPVAALYERGLIHHVGAYPDLEDQFCQWDPSDANSPDRLDAAVWALTELMLGAAGWARGAAS